MDAQKCDFIKSPALRNRETITYTFQSPPHPALLRSRYIAHSSVVSQLFARIRPCRTGEGTTEKHSLLFFEPVLY